MNVKFKVNPGAVKKHTINTAVAVLRTFLFVTLAFVIMYPILTQNINSQGANSPNTCLVYLVGNITLASP